MGLGKRMIAELIGSFWLVLGGCGSAVLAAGFGDHGIGLLGVALAFGLSVATMAWAVGAVSGGHFNPAVTLGLCAGGRFKLAEAPAYILAQCIGASLGAGVLYLIASGQTGFDAAASGFAANGYGAHSPGHYSMQAAILSEGVLTAVFVFIIHGVTEPRASPALAPLAIGLSLCVIHLISIPVTNTSVNPARSTAVALFQGGWALQQLWLFWLVPLVGGLLGGGLYRLLRVQAAPTAH